MTDPGLYDIEMNSNLRVRIAPSPTGAIHLGLARTALFNWAFARGRGGKFLLRVEDTDRERSTSESEQAILAGLKWLGLDWDEGPDVGGEYGPYRQSERIERHCMRAIELLESGHAYRCFCTPERLDALRETQMKAKQTPAYDHLCRSVERAEADRRAEAGEACVMRFRIPEGETRFEDLVRGEVTFQNHEVDDWVMVRRDGNPTYNFVVVCDDLDMRISHVFRGEEHLVNTPKQILLYRAFGEEPPAFGHLPLMLGPDRKKLSKRSGDTSLEDYRAKGYPPEAVLNFLALQGWALDGETEVFSTATLVEKFEIKAVSKGGSIFDFDKFLWLAGEYVHHQAVEHVAACCAPFVIAAGLMTADEIEARENWYHSIVAMERERIRIYSELPARIEHFFCEDDKVSFQPKAEKNARKHAERADTLRDFAAWLADRPEWSADDRTAAAAQLGAETKAWITERGLKLPGLFQPLRCALTGLPGGPDLFETLFVIGRESALRRIEFGIERLKD
ncbi:MAG: glutamyl-tRNA synthetase [Chlamydiales bacterium]